MPKAYYIAKVTLSHANDHNTWIPKNTRVSVNTVLSYPSSDVEPPAVCHNYPAEEDLPFYMEVTCDSLVYGSIVYVDQNPAGSGVNNQLSVSEISVFPAVSVAIVDGVRCLYDSLDR